jgi:hypothetical protein
MTDSAATWLADSMIALATLGLQLGAIGFGVTLGFAVKRWLATKRHGPQ